MQKNELTTIPLYLQVAVWGLKEKRILTTAVVSRRFLITQKQAQDILHYIRHEGRSIISSESVTVRDGIHPACKGLRILAAEITRTPVVKKTTSTDVITSRGMTSSRRAPITPEQRALKELRRWMAIRRPGEQVPGRLLPTELPTGGTHV